MLSSRKETIRNSYSSSKNIFDKVIAPNISQMIRCKALKTEVAGETAFFNL